MCCGVSSVMKLFMLYYFLLNSNATKRHRLIQDRAEKQHLRVVNGDDDTNNEFPFAVVLEIHYIENMVTKSEQVCSGSLISLSWVLTAGHCAVDPVNIVRYGAVNASTTEKNTFTSVLKRIPHPSYVHFEIYDIGNAIHDDIGLILIKPVPVNRRFAKLSAVDYQSLIGLPVKLAGFGMVDMYNPISNISLQVAEGMVIKCDLSKVGISGPEICLVSKCVKHQKMHSGDSGGPLLVGGKLVGVASSGQNEHPSLGYYCPVSPYLQWIQDTMRNIQVPATPNASARRRNGNS